MDLVDVRDQEMIADFVKVVDDEGLPQQTRDQSHIHTGDGRGQRGKVLQGSLLQVKRKWGGGGGGGGEGGQTRPVHIKALCDHYRVHLRMQALHLVDVNPGLFTRSAII